MAKIKNYKKKIVMILIILSLIGILITLNKIITTNAIKEFVLEVVNG